jgi:hypothetical protein
MTETLKAQLYMEFAVRDMAVEERYDARRRMRCVAERATGTGLGS